MNMKKGLLLLLILCFEFIASAQDIIVTQDGTTILSKVIEIGTNEVKYKKFSNLDGPIYCIEKSSILSINYENGEKELFSASSQNNQNDEIKQYDERTPEDDAVNSEVLKLWEQKEAIYEKPRKKKDATILYCALKPTSYSTIADTTVELTFRTIYYYNPNFRNHASSALVTRVNNKSSKTIYLDLGNSFFLRGSQSFPFYVPSASSSSVSYSSGVGINVGVLTGIGSNLNGLNVGSSTSVTSGNTVFSQRIIALPPRSSCDLPVFRFFPTNNCCIMYGGIMVDTRGARYGTPVTFPHLINNVSEQIHIGETVDFKEGELAFNCGVFFSYSFTEDISSPHKLQTTLNIRRIIGVPESYDLFLVRPLADSDAISPSMNNSVHVFLWQIDD